MHRRCWTPDLGGPLATLPGRSRSAPRPGRLRQRMPAAVNTRYIYDQYCRELSSAGAAPGALLLGRSRSAARRNKQCKKRPAAVECRMYSGQASAAYVEPREGLGAVLLVQHASAPNEGFQGRMMQAAIKCKVAEGSVAEAHIICKGRAIHRTAWPKQVITNTGPATKCKLHLKAGQAQVKPDFSRCRLA